jgi:hypothetical protein
LKPRKKRKAREKQELSFFVSGTGFRETSVSPLMYV